MNITALYIHIPFCLSKCRYCAFFSLPAPAADVVQTCLERLGKDFQSAGEICAPLNSIYIGGGTPSFLSEKQLVTLFDLLQKYFSTTQCCEITIECNPGSVSARKLALFEARGVNRVSLGVQSFCKKHRDTLGRLSSNWQIESALCALKESSIHNFGIDLMYGIPGQTAEEWREDVRKACIGGVRHLSTYSLTLEEQTQLAKEISRTVDEDLDASMWTAAEDIANDYGMVRYEVSNFATPGFECCHNLAVWRGKPYIGCGPSAASFDGKIRWTQPRNFAQWVRGAPVITDELPPDARGAELLAFALRTAAGCDISSFREERGVDVMAMRGVEIQKLCQEKLLELRDGHRLVPTGKGMLFADYVASEIII